MANGWGTNMSDVPAVDTASNVEAASGGVAGYAFHHEAP
jgi:hypothetical protein